MVPERCTMRCRLCVETCVCDEPLFTFAEITALTSPTALTPDRSWRIRRWMILRMFMVAFFPRFAAKKTKILFVVAG